MAPDDTVNRMIRQRLEAARQFRGWDHEALAICSGLPMERIKECETAGVIDAVEMLAVAEALPLPVSQFVERCALCGIVSKN